MACWMAARLRRACPKLVRCERLERGHGDARIQAHPSSASTSTRPFAPAHTARMCRIPAPPACGPHEVSHDAVASEFNVTSPTTLTSLRYTTTAPRLSAALIDEDGSRRALAATLPLAAAIVTAMPSVARPGSSLSPPGQTLERANRMHRRAAHVTNGTPLNGARTLTERDATETLCVRTRPQRTTPHLTVRAGELTDATAWNSFPHSAQESSTANGSADAERTRFAEPISRITVGRRLAL